MLAAASQNLLDLIHDLIHRPHGGADGLGRRHVHARVLEQLHRRLGRARLHRDEVALEICAILPEQIPAAVIDLCSVLAEIESSGAVPMLVDLLFDRNARVRGSAGTALEQITGLVLPAEPWIWEEYANG